MGQFSVVRWILQPQVLRLESLEISLFPLRYGLRVASDELKSDREIVMTAVKQHGHCLKWASEKLQADEEVVLTAVVRPDTSFLQLNRYTDEYCGVSLYSQKNIYPPPCKRANWLRYNRVNSTQRRQNVTSRTCTTLGFESRCAEPLPRRVPHQ